MPARYLLGLAGGGVVVVVVVIVVVIVVVVVVVVGGGVVVTAMGMAAMSPGLPTCILLHTQYTMIL